MTRWLRRLASLRWWRAVLIRDHVRLTLASLICTVASIAVPIWSRDGGSTDWLVNTNVVGVSFGGSYLVLTAIAFANSTFESTRAWAHHQRRAKRTWTVRWIVGEARGVSFVISVTVFAVVAAVLMIRSEGGGGLVLALGAAGVVVGWVVMQTSFMLHYAATYHNDGGLVLDDEPRPDMFDFAYLAFTIGTSFTIVDATITDRKLRRVVLGHSVLSFAFNTVLLGLVVTFLAG